MERQAFKVRKAFPEPEFGPRDERPGRAWGLCLDSYLAKKLHFLIEQPHSELLIRLPPPPRSPVPPSLPACETGAASV